MYSTGFTLAGIGERDPGRINSPVIPREGYPSTLLGALNQGRGAPVTPPEMYPSTLAGLPEDLMSIDASRILAMLIGYLTYANLSIAPAFLASILLPGFIRINLMKDIGDNALDRVFADNVAAVLTGLITSRGKGLF